MRPPPSALPAAAAAPSTDLRRNGPTEASDRDHLFALLSRCMPWERAARLSEALIRRFGTLPDVLAAPETQLAGIPELGHDEIALLKSLRTVAMRLVAAPLRDAPILSRWDALLGYLQAALAHERVETFRVLFLDARNHLLADEQMGTGTVNHVPVYPREVVRRALDLHATALILVHNHPSGDPTPSPADVEMTTEVKAAAALFGIVVHDHIIVGRGRCASLRSEGLL